MFVNNYFPCKILRAGRSLRRLCFNYELRIKKYELEISDYESFQKSEIKI